MKRVSLSIILLTVSLLFDIDVYSQCNTSNLVNQGTIIPTTTPQNTGSVNQDRPYWQFNASAGCEYTFTTCGNASWDTYLRLYADGAIGSWSQVASNDDDCSYQSTITWTAPSSGVYNILLTRYGSGTCNTLSGNATVLTFSTNCAAAPACSGSSNVDDLCSGATSLSVNASCITSNWSIDPSYENCVSPSTNCTQNNQVEDAWFQFTATSTSTIINVANTNRRMLFAVYSGACGSLTQIECVDDIATQGTETTTISTNIGDTYYIQVVRTNGDGLTNTMDGTICVYDAPAPTCNDGIQNQGEIGIDCGGPCPACAASSCLDLGFENMASGADQVLVTGWELLVGRNNVSGPYTIESAVTHSSTDCSSNFTSHTGSSHCGVGGTGIKVYHNAYQHHDIETNTTAGINDLVDVPNLPSLTGSNTRCIRLGGEQQAGQQASGMRTTFTISDPYIAYHYILRFEETGHNINDRAFCTFQIKDQGGTILPCGSFEVYENGPTESWAWDNTWDTYYMDQWKTVVMDVSDYIGQDVTIEVWVADCFHGAHAGWGYFDFECLASATADCSITPLPVELVEFKSECIENNPMLLWTTATERDNDYFTIWHSSDGYNYRKVANVNGKGNAETTNHYSLNVEEYLTGNQNYFRLSQTDYNGRSETFKTIAFEDCSEAGTNMYFDGDGVLNIHASRIKSVRILESSGRVVATTKVNGDNVRILTDLGAGVYVVQLEMLNGTMEVNKIFKQY